MTSVMFSEGSMTDIDRNYSQKYGVYDCQCSKPPLRSYLSNLHNEDLSHEAPRISRVEAERLQRPSIGSLNAVQTNCSSLSCTSSVFQCQSESSSFTTRSRSSTLATEYSSTGVIRPTPIPRTTTFVNELVPTQSSTAFRSSSLSKPPMLPSLVQKDQPMVYPTPWGEKKRGGFWGRLKQK